jgi:hypothetical protein
MHCTALLHPIFYITTQFLACFVLVTLKIVIPLEILRPHLGALGGSQAPVEFPAYYGMSRRHRQEKTFLFRHVVVDSLCACIALVWCSKIGGTINKAHVHTSPLTSACAHTHLYANEPPKAYAWWQLLHSNSTPGGRPPGGWPPT